MSKKGPFLSEGIYALWQENGCIEKRFMHLKLPRASPGSSLVVTYDSVSIKTASFTCRNYCRSYHFSSNRGGSGGVNGVSKSNGISSGLLGPLPNQPLPLSAIAAWHITQENSDNPAANDAEQVMIIQRYPFCKYSNAPNKVHVRYRPFLEDIHLVKTN